MTNLLNLLIRHSIRSEAEASVALDNFDETHVIPKENALVFFQRKDGEIESIRVYDKTMKDVL